MEDGKPEMNATPLIDVLLVLLVMLIITVPMATHQTTVGFPFAGKSVRPPIEFLVSHGRQKPVAHGSGYAAVALLSDIRMHGLV